MKKIILISLKLIMVLFLLYFIIVPAIWIEKPFNHKRLKTMSHLKQVLYCCYVLDGYKNTNLSENNIDFEVVIKRHTNLSFNIRFSNKVDLLSFEGIDKDGWGAPLNVDYTTNLTGLSESLSNSLSKYPIVVWSSGPNGMDERCLGDDIPWPASREY